MCVCVFVCVSVQICVHVYVCLYVCFVCVCPVLAAASVVADYIDSEHHKVKFSLEEGVSVLKDVIFIAWNLLTSRASVGMYLVSKYISENTNTTVVFSGEGSDELRQGYIYFHKAPSVQAGENREDFCRISIFMMYYGLIGPHQLMASS